MSEIPTIYFLNERGRATTLIGAIDFNQIDDIHGIATFADTSEIVEVHCKNFGERGWFIHAEDRPAVVSQFSDAPRYFFYVGGHNQSIESLDVDDDMKVFLTLKYTQDISSRKNIRYK